MPWQIKMAYAQPDRMVQMEDEFGKLVWMRQPKSPTRPAREREIETWWEDMPDDAKHPLYAEIRRFNPDAPLA
jgi:hypothetical protein